MEAFRQLNMPGTADLLANFIRDTLEASGFRRLAIAVSGGVDSATAAALAVRSLGPETVFPLFLPYRDWHEAATRRGRQLARALAIPEAQVSEINVAPLVDSAMETLHLRQEPSDSPGYSPGPTTLRIGNLMARVRMIVLFDCARRLEALVLGTENRTEHYLGYYTRFGDEASDLEPLRGLFKTEVVELARHLNVPNEILQAAPTAGLWPGQTDEGEFGFPYAAADHVLHGIFDRGWGEAELVQQGLSSETVRRVRAWVSKVEYKGHLPHIGPSPALRDREE